MNQKKPAPDFLILIVLVVAAIWLCLYAAPSNGKENPLELDSQVIWNMVQVICHGGIETPENPTTYCPSPAHCVGDGGASLGKCQINPRTAYLIGGVDPVREGFAVLQNEARSEVVTMTILVWCSGTHYDDHGRLIHKARTDRIGRFACFNSMTLGYPPKYIPKGWKDSKKTAYQKLRAYAERADAAYKKRFG